MEKSFVNKIIEDVYSDFPCCKITYVNEDGECFFRIKLYITGKICKINSYINIDEFVIAKERDETYVFVQQLLHDIEEGAKYFINNKING